ncbi:signal peptidase I [Leptospira fluminis]|uniref:Signal peptidase I n=1 Tax=Leptospira fluminis TaxID=2484979 RepID=A0A4R9GPC7_9LEPT|nr:signal peptidase I [Leptospira fluminis]TGK18811.1 signal peptidase I [Leptospira fluminis]
MSEPQGIPSKKSLLSAILQDESVSSTFSFVAIVALVLAFKSSVLDANNIPSGSMIPTLKIGDFLFVNKMRYSFRMPFTEKELFRYDDPKRGDIVTFIPPERAMTEPGDARDGLFPKRYVKRVIGLPGDTIRITLTNVHRDGHYSTYSALEYKEQGQLEFKKYNYKEIAPGELLYDLDNTRALSAFLYKEEKPGFEHYVLEGSDSLYYHGSDCYKPTGCTIPEGHYMMEGDNRPDSSDSRYWGFVPREDVLGKAAMIYFSVNWRDSVCQYKSGKELAEKGPQQAEQYEGLELRNKCGDPSANWLLRTILYRIPRMEIRWSRIGTILR